ncbi:DUF1840 domain-containing protein [Acidovorax sp. GBBC 3334]|uniref:DUF1840 domain-containing protein n=1 Tax=Acidovorax sp. GBBC 3334 TaxID=2940496 RepID=UPI0023039F88|nr:DUF1840 domain-containing protein [Acidovorax sp. GBBC 3334]MDA8455549.1 DUF1840 domain-containing protein [Acidovorax sp. GBBC 3334]
MLYKFKSRATADIIMLQAHGRQILQAIGKSPDEAHGIITPDQIPAALQSLEAAIAADEARQAEAGDAPGDEDQDGRGEPAEAVRLRQRAAPFVDMLRRSAAEGKEVTW